MTNNPLIILGTTILPGKSYTLELEIAKLHTRTAIKIPIIVNRAKASGPVVLLMAGVHGDETNGVAIVREIIEQKLHIPTAGTVICIPVLNVFGFLNQSRYFPDGRDLNRMFPGTKNGSLASQFAYAFKKEIAPIVDYVIDFHTGGKKRDNAPQIRCDFEDSKLLELAKEFNAPFTIHSAYLKKSIRETLSKMGVKPLLFEGGFTKNISEDVVSVGVQGAVNVLRHLGMQTKINPSKNSVSSTLITKSKWLRAPYSGMFNATIENGTQIKKGAIMGVITDPFGEFKKEMKAPFDCHVFCVNRAPIVNKGNAVFHVSVEK